MFNINKNGFVPPRPFLTFEEACEEAGIGPAHLGFPDWAESDPRWGRLFDFAERYATAEDQDTISLQQVADAYASAAQELEEFSPKEQVEICENLDQLFEVIVRLQKAEEAYPKTPKLEEVVDLTSLPNFGGEAPAETLGIFSWDKERLLMHDSSWKLIFREDE